MSVDYMCRHSQTQITDKQWSLFVLGVICVFFSAMDKYDVFMDRLCLLETHFIF